MMRFLRRILGFSEDSRDTPTTDAAEMSEEDPPSGNDCETTTGDGSQSHSMAMRLTISSFRRTFPNIKGVTTETVHKWYQEGVGGASLKTGEVSAPAGRRALVVVDSRPEEEYKISHIPGCVRIGHTIEDDDSLISLIDSTVKEDEKDFPKTVVMYCSLGYRSCMLANKLVKAIKTKGSSAAAFDNVEIYNMEGGLFKWAMEGSPMVNKSGKPTKYVHPYSAVFGKLLEASRRRYEESDDD